MVQRLCSTTSPAALYNDVIACDVDHLLSDDIYNISMDHDYLSQLPPQDAGLFLTNYLEAERTHRHLCHS